MLQLEQANCYLLVNVMCDVHCPQLLDVLLQVAGSCKPKYSILTAVECVAVMKTLCVFLQLTEAQKTLEKLQETITFHSAELSEVKHLKLHGLCQAKTKQKDENMAL